MSHHLPSQLLVTKEMRDRYIQRRRIDLDRLQIAIAEKNSETLLHVGHQIKGNAASFQFPELETLAIKIEDAGHKQDYAAGAKLLEEFRLWLSTFSA
jgi:HPt (histidine-containing phosphotransfer) domain-containing protein